MIAEFVHTIRRLRGQAIAWSIGLILYGLLVGSMYDSIMGIEGISELLESYPPEILAFFGEMTEMTKPWGYLDVEYFTLINLILGIFAIGTSVRLLAGDEEKGLLDLVLAHPVSRFGFFWGRLSAIVFVLTALMLVSWLSLTIPSKGFGFDLTPIELSRPFLSLFAILIFFSAFALLASMLLPSSRSAGMLTGMLMVGNFLLVGLSNINTDLEQLVKLTPIYYYQGGEAIISFEWAWFIGLLLSALLFTLLACMVFIKRDIRVSGEQSWTLSLSSISDQITAEFNKLIKGITEFGKTRRKELRSKQSSGTEKRKWFFYVLTSLGLILLLCFFTVIVIDLANLWCGLFGGFFNLMYAGTCP